MENLLTAITSRVTTGPSTFYNDIGGRFYLDTAPDDRQFPDCIFLIVVDIPDNAFAKYGETVEVQFSLFSESSGATEITTMYRDLKALFDDVKLTVTSNTMVIMKRERLVTFNEEIITAAGTQKVKHWAIDYTVVLQLN